MHVLLNLFSAFDTIDHNILIFCAFDTIDHNILVEKMQEFGITNCAKNWLESCLKDGYSRVCVLAKYSEKHLLKYGVPPGLVAGLPISNAYAQPVAAIINNFQVAYHTCADDTQLYISFFFFISNLLGKNHGEDRP